ncbi:hypothetical protein A3759_00550 [Thalassolituus sp. HI0120]|nr:hypothetical protein A3759_00550 [Thalassolituus sp. HI0120]
MTNLSEYEKSCAELKALIKAENNLSQEKFAKDYFYYVYGGTAVDESVLSSHFERFKSRIKKGADSRSPEQILAYIRFFKDTYCKDGTHTPSDRDAAWSMFVELDTRIATREFVQGDIESALSSLAALFSLHRNISKDNGHRCRRYYELTNAYLEEHLRPFISKHHETIANKENIDRNIFKEELIKIQAKLTILKKELIEIAR